VLELIEEEEKRKSLVKFAFSTEKLSINVIRTEFGYAHSVLSKSVLIMRNNKKMLYLVNATKSGYEGNKISYEGMPLQVENHLYVSKSAILYFYNGLRVYYQRPGDSTMLMAEIEHSIPKSFRKSEDESHVCFMENPNSIVIVASRKDREDELTPIRIETDYKIIEFAMMNDGILAIVNTQWDIIFYDIKPLVHKELGKDCISNHLINESSLAHLYFTEKSLIIFENMQLIRLLELNKNSYTYTHLSNLGLDQGFAYTLHVGLKCIDQEALFVAKYLDDNNVEVSPYMMIDGTFIYLMQPQHKLCLRAVTKVEISEGCLAVLHGDNPYYTSIYPNLG